MLFCMHACSFVVADHVLALLGRLNTKAALQSRVKLVEELCKVGHNIIHSHLIT